MVDYNYPERVVPGIDISFQLTWYRCTTSALSALKYFSKLDPTYRSADIS